MPQMAVLLLLFKFFLENMWFMNKKNKNNNPDEELQEFEDNLMDEQLASEDTDKSEELTKTTALENELADEKDRYLRLFAEFENFKKRTARERIELFKTAGEDVILSLLPVIDDFERALKELQKGDEDHHLGIKLIYDKFKSALRTKGLELIEVNPGDAFDADIMEAVTQIPAPDEKLKGKVVDVIERGYRLSDKIIRFPKVVVGQ